MKRSRLFSRRVLREMGSWVTTLTHLLGYFCSKEKRGSQEAQILLCDYIPVRRPRLLSASFSPWACAAWITSGCLAPPSPLQSGLDFWRSGSRSGSGSPSLVRRRRHFRTGRGEARACVGQRPLRTSPQDTGEAEQQEEERRSRAWLDSLLHLSYSHISPFPLVSLLLLPPHDHEMAFRSTVPRLAKNAALDAVLKKSPSDVVFTTALRTPIARMNKVSEKEWEKRI